MSVHRHILTVKYHFIGGGDVSGWNRLCADGEEKVKWEREGDPL